MGDRVISGFQGAYRFLSNFYQHENGPTGEHYFQAAKAATREEYEWVMAAETPGQAKYRGRSVHLRDDWEDVKIEKMLEVVRFKFSNPILRRWLDSTGDAELIESNSWKDTFWGVDENTFEGENHLGKILMQVREENRQADEPRRV